MMHRRILHIVEATDAGVGRHVLDLLGGLVDEEWEVHLLYSPRRMHPSFEQTLSTQPRIKAVALPMRRSIHPEDLYTVRRILRYIKEHGPFAVIHGHSSKGGALARLAGRASQIPSVYTPNAFVTMNPELSPLKAAIYRFAECRLGKMGDLLIAVSEAEREHALFLGIPPRAIAVVPNGIHPPQLCQRTKARDELGLDKDREIVGFVGRLFAQKAPQTLLRAFADCVDAHPSAILAIIGDGPLRSSLERLAGTLGIADRVRWLGARDGQQAMPAFDVFALSSAYEGMPYVLLEAAHAGLPIVATDVSGVRSVVCDGENGIIVPPGDPQAMARAIRTILSNHVLRRQYAEASAHRAREWTCDRMVQQTSRLYELATSRRFPGARACL